MSIASQFRREPLLGKWYGTQPHLPWIMLARHSTMQLTLSQRHWVPFHMQRSKSFPQGGENSPINCGTSRLFMSRMSCSCRYWLRFVSPPTPEMCSSIRNMLDNSVALRLPGRRIEVARARAAAAEIRFRLHTVTAGNGRFQRIQHSIIWVGLFTPPREQLYAVINELTVTVGVSTLHDQEITSSVMALIVDATTANDHTDLSSGL
uniref:Uncharacterized protein n=1 Tax=Anopheles atroparvus TaxID=41427 RepID=A0A182J653_ANOAO